MSLAAWVVIILAFALALVDWIAIQRGLRKINLVTKPAVLLVLAAGVWLLGDRQGSMLWFGLALLFSLAGDVLLMLPPSFFLPGLGAFLLAHVGYILAFNTASIQLPPDTYLYFIPIGMIAYFVSRKIVQALPERYGRRMRWPLAAYSIAVALMFYSALNTLMHPDWNFSAAVVVINGAALFLVSDTMLAYDRFINPFKNARLLVRITYHLGQIALTAGALLQYTHLF